jgi:redox-sensitive bicupin YhaK (pirin superfamily)
MMQESDVETAVRVRKLEKIVVSIATSDGAGVRLRRSLGTDHLPQLDPFLMLDEFRSDDPSAYIAGFPDHPHRGFETVTYMLAGRMRHQDNQGNSGTLTAGSVQWMTAGRGIVHSEMPEQERGLMWGFQLWVNLPARDKMSVPRYQEFPAVAIPTVAAPGGTTVKVIAGEFDGVVGPVKAAAVDAHYLDVSLAPQGVFEHELPAGHNVFFYVFEGAVKIDGLKVRIGELGVLGPGRTVSLRAADDKPVRLLLLAGRPINEPVARYGPFVMNTMDELRTAFADYQAGKF